MDHPHLIPHCCHRITIQGEREGFMLVPPPIWIILTLFRTVVTASLYKVRERRFYARPSSYYMDHPHLSPYCCYRNAIQGEGEGFMLVPPPIWIILTSFRTVVTASLYKVRERVLCSSLLLYGSSSPHSALFSPRHYIR
jgi:hypothetical protein